MIESVITSKVRFTSMKGSGRTTGWRVKESTPLTTESIYQKPKPTNVRKCTRTKGSLREVEGMVTESAPFPMEVSTTGRGKATMNGVKQS